MDAKTVRSIINDLNAQQAHLLTKLKRMDSERIEIRAEISLNEGALSQWNEALEEVKNEGER